MTKTKRTNYYDLEERTLKYARAVRKFVKKIDKKLINIDDCKQLIRSSGSVGANYIEANEAISKKDFIHRIKICRKEVKESRYWLQLIDLVQVELDKEKDNLIQESIELMKIFGAILEKCKK